MMVWEVEKLHFGGNEGPGILDIDILAVNIKKWKVAED